MVVVNIQESTWSPGEAEKAEQAYVQRIYLQRKYVDIAAELGYEGTARLQPGEVAMQAVQRFDDEIKAGLRPRPLEPKRRRSGWESAPRRGPVTLRRGLRAAFRAVRNVRNVTED
jgi:hypothetical protein